MSRRQRVHSAMQGFAIRVEFAITPLPCNVGERPGVNHRRSACFVEEGGLPVNTYASSVRFCAASGCKLVAAFMILALCTVTMAPSAWSQDSTSVSSSGANDGGNPSSAGLQAAAVLTTVVYFPLKAAFAIGGGIVGDWPMRFQAGMNNRLRAFGPRASTAPTSLRRTISRAIGLCGSWGLRIRTVGRNQSASR